MYIQNRCRNVRLPVTVKRVLLLPRQVSHFSKRPDRRTEEREGGREKEKERERRRCHHMGLIIMQAAMLGNSSR